MLLLQNYRGKRMNFDEYLISDAADADAEQQQRGGIIIYLTCVC